MSQCFRVINIDKWQDLGLEGKFVDYFLGQYPRDLLFALALSTDSPIKAESYYSGTRPALVGSWAGDRIICLGDHSKDIPDGILGNMEWTEFVGLLDYVEHISMNYIRGIPGLGSADDNVWVLRNLTKREYIRSDVDGLCPDFHGEKIVHALEPGLGHALVSRISWSSDPNFSMKYHGIDKVARGVWAGDRFDIRTVDSLEDGDGDVGEWKDVSEEVVAELLAMWDSG